MAQNEIFLPICNLLVCKELRQFNNYFGEVSRLDIPFVVSSYVVSI